MTLYVEDLFVQMDQEKKYLSSFTLIPVKITCVLPSYHFLIRKERRGFNNLGGGRRDEWSQ
jgi:hypothetical protein